MMTKTTDKASERCRKEENKTSKAAEHNAANDGDRAINDAIMGQEHRVIEPLSGVGESKDESTAGEDTPTTDYFISDKKRPFEDNGDDVKLSDENEPLPTFPLKKARTAYFIFADEKREELKQLVSAWSVLLLLKFFGMYQKFIIRIFDHDPFSYVFGPPHMLLILSSLVFFVTVMLSRLSYLISHFIAFHFA